MSQDGDRAVEQSSSALSTLYRTTVSLEADDACADVDLGPIADRSCFLTGIHGEFRGGYVNLGPPLGLQLQQALARALPVEGDDITTGSPGNPGTIVYDHWIARVCSGGATGAGIKASFACVPSVMNHRAQLGVSGNATATAQETSIRQCMLSGIATTDVDSGRPDFNAVVQPTGGAWVLSAGSPPGAGTDSAWAVCFDTTPGTLPYALYPGAPLTALITPASVDTASCGLTQIQLGAIQFLTPTLSEGVDVRHIADSGWWLERTASNSVTAMCLE